MVCFPTSSPSRARRQGAHLVSTAIGAGTASSPLECGSVWPRGRGRPRPGAVAAFTLVEVILALGLATGLLLVALTFYHQATEMRSQLLRESEQVSTMRLVLDRLAGDLRGVQCEVSPGTEFTGGSNSMSFVKLVCTSPPPSGAASRSGQMAVPTGLVRISLNTLFATNETGLPVVSGLDRSESPLTSPAPNAALGGESEPVDSFLLATTADEIAVYPLIQTNVVTEPFADIVRFVRFRYWDGMAWQPVWTNATPPPGVEIVLSTVASLEDAQPDTYPPEAFRRVVVVPGGTRRSELEPDADASTNSVPL